MKTRRLAIAFVLLVLIASTMVPAASAQAPDPESSIVAGLAWLASQEGAPGSWGGGCEEVAYTGMVVLKFESRAHELGLDPLSPDYIYSGQVARGLQFIADRALTMPISPEPAGDPDGNGNGIGVYWSACGSHVIYNTGIAMMALAASGHPELYGLLVQDAVDFLAFAQADPACGVHRGGWRYNPDECSSDNSNSGYATLGLGYAQAAPPLGFGLTVPQFVMNELSIWIDLIQDDVNGDPNDGGSWYDPGNSSVNIYKTGNLIYEMGLVGDSAATPRVMDAVDYIERQWNGIDPWCGGAGMWRNNRQAMFAMMKGLESLGIVMLDLDGDGTPETDWFVEVAQHLIDTQNPDGSWPTDCWAGPILSTTWALLTLEKAVPPSKPTCPKDAAIDIEKFVNGEDADAAPGPEIPVGAPVTWTYEVTNSGLVPLHGIIVADNKLGTVCKAAILDPGATMLCEKIGTAIQGPYVNLAKAGGTCVAENGKKNSVKDSDYAHYLGVVLP